MRQNIAHNRKLA